MTLKEKFFNWYPKQDAEFISEKCEEIADEFAIEFAEWKEDNTLRVDLDKYKVFGDTENDKPHTFKELLEMYKKEKGYVDKDN